MTELKIFLEDLQKILFGDAAIFITYADISHVRREMTLWLKGGDVPTAHQLEAVFGRPFGEDGPLVFESLNKRDPEPMKIKVGDPVIISECDEPSARMIAVVTRVGDDGQRVEGVYLDEWAAGWYHGRNGRRVLSVHGDARHIVDFGKWLAIDHPAGTFKVYAHESDPCATYSDGQPRHWVNRWDHEGRQMSPQAVAFLRDLQQGARERSGA